MTVTKGKEGVVKAADEVIGELKSFSITETANEVDTSTMNSDWTGVDSTQKSWKGKAVVFWDANDAGQTALVNGSKVELTMYPGGETTGLSEWTGTVLVTSVETPASHDNLIEQTFEFTGDGALTKGTLA